MPICGDRIDGSARLTPQPCCTVRFHPLPTGRSANVAHAVIARSVNMADGWVSTILAEVSCDACVAEEGSSVNGEVVS
jgi:hypothetical protein